ncbi:MAG: hypothetical protein IKZ96_03875 [Bacilli bacterium]|nr:hypothetical protein [Bacilli bacterium]
MSKTSTLVIPLKEKLDLRTEKVMENVRMARVMHLTKDQHIYSHMAEEFISDMSKYAKYCREDKKDDWTNHIRVIVYGTGSQSIDDSEIECHLQAYEVAGIIMEEAQKGTSYEDLKTFISYSDVVDEELFHKLYEYAEDWDIITRNLFGETLVKLYKQNREKPGSKKQD